MKNSFAGILSLLLLSVTACSGDDEAPVIDASIPDAAPPDAVVVDAAPPSPDARPANLGCTGSDAGTVVVPDPLTIAGDVESVGLGTPEPIAGATVEARKVTDDTVVASGTSDKTSAYSLSVVTTGVSVAGYLRVVAADHLPSNLFTPDPLTDNVTGLTVPMFPDSLVPLLAQFSGTQIVEGSGLAIIQVEDCIGESIEGAVVTVTGGNSDTKVVYAGPGMPIPDPNRTYTSTSGTVFILNIPPGSVTVSAAVGDFPPAQLSSDLKIFADEVSLGQIVPF